MDDDPYKFSDAPKFVPQKLETEKDSGKGRVFTIRLNDDESKQLEEVMNFLQQPKDSTAYKQMFKIGYTFVLHDQKIKLILDQVLNNRRKNWRTGIQPEQFENWQM